MKWLYPNKRSLIWVAVVTLLLLMIPFLLMLFQVPVYDPGGNYGIVNWRPADFVIMGLMIFGTGSLLVLAFQKILQKSYRVAAGAAIIFGFLWFWAELAVGVFTNWGS